MAINEFRFHFLKSRIPMSLPLNRFSAWWRKEFLSVFPERAVEWLMGNSRKVLIIVPAGTFTDIELIGDARRNLGSERVDTNIFSTAAIDRFLSERNLDRSTISIGVRLLPNQIFHRTLMLPVQAEQQFDQIATRDLTTKTPFRLQDIYVGSACTQTSDSKTVTVYQWIVLRRIAQDAFSDLKLSIEDIDFVETSPDANVVPNIPLRSGGNHGVSWTSKTIRGLIISAVLLASIAAITEYWRQQSALDTLGTKIATARVNAQRVRAIIDKLEQQQAMVFQLRSRKSDTPGLLDLWEETSRLLPSHSWLTELRLSQIPTGSTQQISMAGFSSAASTLVGLVDQSALFTEASLTAPVTLDPTQGQERFSLQAKLRYRDNPAKKKP